MSTKTRVIQITNVSPNVTQEQLRNLFSFIGNIAEVRLYPEETSGDIALHLNNTVFLDRALIVLPYLTDNFSLPDEKYANLIRTPPQTAAGVPPRSADWPLDVISIVVGKPGEQIIQTIEPRLQMHGFPLYPNLPVTTDGNKIEEIRKTILVTNLDPETTGNEVMDFFNQHAEVRCVRMAGNDMDRAAYVEFTDQKSILTAFALMGTTLKNRNIMIQHSSTVISKPSHLNNMIREESNGKESARSRSSSKHRSRSKSKKRESRSKSRGRHKHSKSRNRSRSRGQRSRSKRRSKSRKRSRSRSKKRSHSRRLSKSRRKSSRSRSRHSKRRSRSRESKSKHSKSSRHRRSRSRESKSKKSHRKRSRSSTRRHRHRSGSRKNDKKSSHKRRSRSKTIEKGGLSPLKEQPLKEIQEETVKNEPKFETENNRESSDMSTSPTKDE